MTDLERIWRAKTDAQLNAAAAAPSDYEPGARTVILAEFARRGLGSAPFVDLDTEQAYIDTLGLASPRARVGARLIDGFVGALPMIVLLMWVETLDQITAAETAVAGLWSLGYHFLGDAVPGGSFGKRLLRINVVDFATRQPCTLGRSVIRRFPEVVPGLNLVDALFLFRPKRQRLGDVMAGTIVVTIPQPAPVDAPERP